MCRFLPFAVLLLAPIALSAQGQVNTLYTFEPNDNATACQTQADNGNLYGGSSTFNPASTAAPTYFQVNSCNWLQGTDGNFYYWMNGTVTKVTPAGTGTVIVDLGAGSSNEVLDVVQASDGNFYGVAEFDGTYSAGTIFSFTSSGNATTLYDFTAGPDGQDPMTLLQGLDGDLYGSTYDTFFRYGPGDQLTVLANTGFSALVEGENQIFYGVTTAGGFASIAPNGAVTSYPAASTLGYSSYSGPCFAGGDANIYCSASGTDASGDTHQDIVQFTPAGGASTYIVMDYGQDGGGSIEQYALAGDGSFYGALTYDVDYHLGGYSDTFIYNATGTPVVPAIDISLSNTQAVPGQSNTLTWNLKNGFSDNMKLCFASGGWAGVQAVSGSITALAPSTPGTYRYALTCGGVETSAVTLYDAVPQVTLTASPTELAAGVPITFTATITGNNGTAQGTVDIVNNANNEILLSIPVNKSGMAAATIPTTGVPAGYYSLSANYTGSKSYAAAQSANVDVQVLASKYPCDVLYLSISPTTVGPGQTITLTSDVATYSDGVAASGTVTFKSGSLTLGTASIPQESPNEATLSLQVPQIPAGNYGVTATFNGNSTITGGCTSSSEIVTVTGTPTSTLTLEASPGTVTPPASVTLTATQSTAQGKPTPTGTVQFYDGPTYLGASSLNGSGMATFDLSTSGYSAGTVTTTANYAGDANYSKDSAMASFTVQ